MIKGVTNIKSLCELGLGNSSGIRSLSFADMKSYDNLGQLKPGASVYTIEFSKWNGSYSEEGNTAAAGDYYVQQAQIVVPRYRFTTDRIVRELKDRRVVVFIKDRNDDQHTIVGARFRSKYTTGSNPSDKSGYEWTFAGSGTKKYFYQQFSNVVLNGDDGYQDGDEFDFDYEPSPGTPGGIEACCISILTTPIEYVPTPTGNLLHKNKVVTVAASGDKYFIDQNGISILLSKNGFSKEKIEGTGASMYTLSTNYDPNTILVNRTQNVLTKGDTPLINIDTFTIEDNILYLPTDWPLEPGEYLEIYKTA